MIKRRSAVAGGPNQGIARVDALVSALAAHPHGLRLIDASREAGLSMTAAHRLLSGLVAYGLADLDEESARYFVGMKVVAWSRAATHRFALKALAAPGLARLAREFGDAAYFLVRRGDDVVCLDRVEGEYPVKTLLFDVGDTRPLGVGAGSVSMLSCLPAPEVERIIASRHEARLPYRLSDEDVRRMVADARRQGFSYVEGRIVSGIGTVGVPVVMDGVPVAALSVSAIQARMDKTRRAQIASALLREAAGIAGAGR